MRADHADVRLRFPSTMTGDLSYNAQGAQNWGYDPENYNVPEGSYSSDPSNPARVTEMKQMVKGLLGTTFARDHGWVIYNHVYKRGQPLTFNKTVRATTSGTMPTVRSCNNSELRWRYRLRQDAQVHRHSVTYWAKNYNVDGFDSISWV